MQPGAGAPTQDPAMPPAGAPEPTVPEPEAPTGGSEPMPEPGAETPDAGTPPAMPQDDQQNPGGQGGMGGDTGGGVPPGQGM